jgi:hypothetical protein
MFSHKVLDHIFGFNLVVARWSFSDEGRYGVFTIFIDGVNDNTTLYAASVDAGKHLGDFAMIHHLVQELELDCLLKVQELRNKRKNLRFKHS